MRADIDHVVGNSVESCKDESKPQNCLEEKWEDAELKGLENGKNNDNVCELFYDTRTGEELDKDNDGNQSCEAGKKLGVDNMDAENGSLETVDPVFFMDKNVTACDLPEIVVCYKEGTYHMVKDICVDEGVPVQEKFLFGEKGSVKCSSDSNQCESEDLMKTDKETETTKSSEDRSGKVDTDSEICSDPKTNQDVEESPREEFADAEGTRSCCNRELLIVTREAKDSSEISHEIEEATLENNVPKESLTLGDILSWEDEPKPLSNNSNNSDKLDEQSPPQLQEKEKDEPKEAEEKLSSVSTVTPQEPNKTFNDLEKPETDKQQPNLLVGDSLEDNKLISNGFGETSFSAAEAVSISGHITYRGPIAFSGSLSVRSDASTASGRSFAFPVLQSEWNSSPVRMAKPEKRRHKGWRQILLCCRSS
ncbi:18S pre-ribosomal assembly protein gar2-like protein [Hirschfeldia incana]|nr:18S pre-ribosomal assembly protein gar2-like protein [Hirschfeldia incana]KAJ0228704.1 18S pre-ribosomal assembly protein gar2-like protein [Hirschfeldia incana]KAJ0228705.1 18S pre-ribosomal assembly protein gar2-like protein [Hirschfeldia incana]KAJ0228706.1 18S pre-ribosomal assembly protein gar2-like protein [Hirschfeldia incana]